MSNANEVRTNTGPEVRFTSGPIEVRANPKNANELVLTGYPIVFGSKGTVYDRSGSFDEYVKPGATRGLENERIALLVNHDSSAIPLAATWSTKPSIEWHEDKRGVFMRAVLDANRQDCNDAAAAVHSGILSKMSFSFTREPGFQDSWTTRDGRDERTISKFGGLRDFSLVQDPAYAGTSVEAAQRSLARMEHLVDTAEYELRSGRALSKSTIASLVPAVGSLLAAGQHVDAAHKNVTKLLAKHGVSLKDAVDASGNQGAIAASDGSGSNPIPLDLGSTTNGDAAIGGNLTGDGAWNLPMADGTGSCGRRPTAQQRSRAMLYAELLDDERRKDEQMSTQVREALAELRKS